MTGKGDRWGRDRQVGRSAPACLSASTIVLPSTYLHCTARGRPTSSAAVVFAARPANCWLFVVRPVPGGESAGCVACSGLVLQAVFACHVTFAMSSHYPSHVFAPVLFTLLCPCSFHVRQDQATRLQATRTVLLAAATRACRGGPCADF